MDGDGNRERDGCGCAVEGPAGPRCACSQLLGVRVGGATAASALLASCGCSQDSWLLSPPACSSPWALLSAPGTVRTPRTTCQCLAAYHSTAQHSAAGVVSVIEKQTEVRSAPPSASARPTPSVPDPLQAASPFGPSTRLRRGPGVISTAGVPYVCTGHKQHTRHTDNPHVWARPQHACWCIEPLAAAAAAAGSQAGVQVSPHFLTGRPTMKL